MNLADLNINDLLKIKAVSKELMRLHEIVFDGRYSDKDSVLIRNNKFEVIKVQDVIIVKNIQEEMVRWSTKFALGVTHFNIEDRRGYSTRYQTDRLRSLHRKSLAKEPAILKTNLRTVFRRDYEGDEEFITYIPDCTEEEFSAVLFQQSLVSNEAELNVAVLDYLFRDLFMGDNGNLTVVSHLANVHEIIEFHECLFGAIQHYGR